ncbi:hypothetical protein [Allomuricauda sp. d1]|uniref:hypothetical protein n=1 Tax=Allomuricauda sp. d1 TaxID=3136725 RepID=UPI0031D8228F
MKKFVPILAVLFLTAFGAQAAERSEDRLVPNYVRGYGNSFIFVENGVTFSVYPDGEFDFYIDNQVNVGVGARIGNVGVTFNSGFNYNPFVQYDDYGAVIQVENVPIFYDFYGRVSLIGSVDVWYRNGRVRRLGGLNVFWNGAVFSHYTGFINRWNRFYVYRPFHRWFARPAVGFCTVWNTPYRRFYTPVRYTWYRPYRNNFRRPIYDFGRRYSRYDNGYSYRNHSRRSKIYRNDNRVAVRQNRGRSNRDYTSRNAVTERRTVSRSNRDGLRANRNRVAVDRNKSVKRSNVRRGDGNTVSRRSSSVNRSSRGNTVTQRSVTKTPRRTTVTKKEVTRSPGKRTVTQRSKTYRKPQARTNRSVVSNKRSVQRSSTVKRSAPKRSSVSRSSSPSKRSTVSRSSTSRSSRNATSSRSSRSSRSRSSRVNR